MSNNNTQLPKEVIKALQEPVKEFTGDWKAFIADLKPHLMKYANRYKDPTGTAFRHINSEQLSNIYTRMCSRLEDKNETWVGIEYEEALKEIAGELFYPSI